MYPTNPKRKNPLVEGRDQGKEYRQRKNPKRSLSGSVCVCVHKTGGRRVLKWMCQPEIPHTLDPSFLSFPALSAGAYTTTLVVMEAVVS
jgi:hypothetical protein